MPYLYFDIRLIFGIVPSVRRRHCIRRLVQEERSRQSNSNLLCHRIPELMTFGSQIEIAFSAGYDPALELAIHGKKRQEQLPEESSWGSETPWTEHLRRDEQDLVDRIVHGKEGGRYYILLGPKVAETPMGVDM